MIPGIPKLVESLENACAMLLDNLRGSLNLVPFTASLVSDVHLKDSHCVDGFKYDTFYQTEKPLKP